MATSGIVAGAVKVVNDASGDGWGNGILTLPAAPSGSNRFRFAIQAYAEPAFVAQPRHALGQNLSTWLGLRFTNTQLATSTIDNSVPDAN